MKRHLDAGNDAIALVTDLGSRVSPDNLPEVVDVGAALWVLTEYAGNHLDTVKGILRDHARKQGFGTHLITGTGTNRCQVVVAEPTATISNPEDLRPLLGDTFHWLFAATTTYKPRSNFMQRVLELPEGPRKIVLQHLKMLDATPRVSFKVSGDPAKK